MDVKTLIVALSELPKDYHVTLEGCDCNINAVRVAVVVPRNSRDMTPFVIICCEDGPGYFRELMPEEYADDLPLKPTSITFF